MASKTRVAGAAAVVVLTVGLSGCSEDGNGSGTAEGAPKGAPSGASEAQAVKAAYRTTVAADTARMTVASKATAKGKSVTVRGEGVMNLEAGDSQVTLTAQGQRIEQRVLDGVVYQKPPAAQRAELPRGKTWMKIDLARLKQSASGNQDGQVSDPAEPFTYTKGVSDRDVEKMGTETIDGARTTHYRVTVDVKALAEGDSAKAEQMRRQLGTSTVPLDMWLDEQGRLRQETVRLTLRPQTTDAQKTPAVTSTTTLRFSDFGTKADVRTPPAKGTVDVTQKLARATKSPGTA
ncbi:hypothetical protein OG985_42230 [Streptomyces sp. NBC_00289]|uniref:hypothetical protein n=1 Tax=Streptomyces sp. NBC_00289 TaxID=2975703 RepID=UPI00324F237F